MEDLFETTAEEGARHLVVWSDEASGLKALCVIDDVTLGPAAGGIRTQPYPSVHHALADAVRLARAMTMKCALGGLDAGGGKIVVLDHGELDRPRAFAELGRRIQDLGGTFRAGSDLGTRPDDLSAAADQTDFVHFDVAGVSRGVARGVQACIEACVRVRGLDGLAGVRVAVQGCGTVGAAVARSLSAAGAKVLVADVDEARAARVADEEKATAVSAADILTADVDVVSPCALGGVLTATRASQLKAWAVCGGANNILAAREVGALLKERGVLYVPDVVSSAGGVIEGVARDVMGASDTGPMIDALGPLAQSLLEEAAAEGLTPTEVAERRARARIAAAPRRR